MTYMELIPDAGKNADTTRLMPNMVRQTKCNKRRMTNAYPDRGKQTLGDHIDRFIDDRSMWPQSLHDFFADIQASDPKKKFGASILLDWMAQESGIPELADPFYKSSFEKLLSRYRTWRFKPSGSAGDNFVLLHAIAVCGIVRDKNGEPIKSSDQLISLLFGRE